MKLDELVDKRKLLDEKFEEVDTERRDKDTNCKWDREDAGILRDNALKALSVVCAIHFRVCVQARMNIKNDVCA